MKEKLIGSNIWCLPILLVAGLLLNACTSTENAPLRSTVMPKETSAANGGYLVSQQAYNKLVVMEYMEALSTTNHQAVAAKLLAPDYLEIRPEFHNMNYHASGSELANLAQPMLTAIPDRRDIVDVVMAEDNKVAVRYRILGTHQANFHGIPATGKGFDIDAAALFTLADGKITTGWFMAEEAGLLKQIGQPLPARKDGRWEAGPSTLPVMTGDEHIAILLDNPVDSQAYRNKLMINAYKAKNPPAELKPKPEQYGAGLRRGFANLTNSAPAAAAKQHPFGGAFPDRVDMVADMMAEGKWVMILFRLTAINSESLFGIPALDRPVAGYEFGFMEFDGEDWVYRWFFGDDLGMLLQMGGPQDYWFKGDD